MKKGINRKYWGLLPLVILLSGALFTACELDPQEEDEPATEQSGGENGGENAGENGGGDNPGQGASGFPQTLKGTIWQWQHRAYFFDETEDGFVNYHRMAEFGGSPPEIIPYAYTYNPETGRGEIDYRGKFRLQADGTMFFPNYSSYGHNATFERVEEAIWPKD